MKTGELSSFQLTLNAYIACQILLGHWLLTALVYRGTWESGPQNEAD